MEILNIDELARVKRQLQYKGKTHDVVELSVQAFIDNLKAAEDIEAHSNSSESSGDLKVRLSQQVEASVSAILESVPTMPREDLVDAPHTVLVAILKFIRGDLDPSVKGAAGETAEGQSAKKD